MIDYQDDVEKQKTYLSNRRKALIGDGPSGVKQGFEDDFLFINLTITKSDELLTKFSSILSKLNDTMALFKRTKIQDSSAKELSAKQKRSAKENARKAEKQRNEVIEKRTKEILVGFFGEEKGAELLKDLYSKEEKEAVDVHNEMNLSFTESLRFKFHLKASQGIADSGLFKGETKEILREQVSILKKKQEDQAAEKEDKNNHKKTEQKFKNCAMDTFLA